MNPCNPCLRPIIPCEQCMFGYNSKEHNHELLLNLIEEVIKGNEPDGYILAEEYMNCHDDWKNYIKQGGYNMYYIDTKTGELVDKKDPTAPPERYYEYRRGIDNKNVKETYVISYEPLKLVEYVYPSIYGNFGRVAEKYRKEFLSNNNITNPVLYARTVPPKDYDARIGKNLQIKFKYLISYIFKYKCGDKLQYTGSGNGTMFIYISNKIKTEDDVHEVENNIKNRIDVDNVFEVSLCSFNLLEEE